MPIIGDRAIHEENGQWWFWNETWTTRYGPFSTREECAEELAKYLKYLDGPSD